MATESVKIDTEILEKVRNHVSVTKQTISGFIEIAIDEKLHGYKIGFDPYHKARSTKGGKK